MTNMVSSRPDSSDQVSSVDSTRFWSFYRASAGLVHEQLGADLESDLLAALAELRQGVDEWSW